jgi:hypothetical protein
VVIFSRALFAGLRTGSSTASRWHETTLASEQRKSNRKIFEHPARTSRGAGISALPVKARRKGILHEIWLLHSTCGIQYLNKESLAGVYPPASFIQIKVKEKEV